MNSTALKTTSDTRVACLRCGEPALPGSMQLCNACWVKIRDQPLETAGNIFRARDREGR